MINFHPTARTAFEHASAQTRTAATAPLTLLSHGFQVTWFRETASLIWLAAIKPSRELGDHFGLRQECFVLGNGHPKDFHQRTLQEEPPAEIAARLDPAIRFVASDVAIAETFCVAWAVKQRASVVVVRTENATEGADALYGLLSRTLWRRDLFGETEPVRLPSDFFGREATVNELYAKITSGAPVAVFGLRKIGKSSLLARVEDLLADDDSSITAFASLMGNATKTTSGRWWHVAQDIVAAWKQSLRRTAAALGSPVSPRADRLAQAVERKSTDPYQLASTFEKDVLELRKCAQALATGSGRGAARLVLFVDECDHLYPHVENAAHWRTDFFALWNALQSIKRSLPPEDLVYVLGGVNPSGVEQGALEGNPNPLYETQRIYLTPMSRQDADSLMNGLGARMGLAFTEEALAEVYGIVGGHPLLLRRMGSELHTAHKNRSALKRIDASDVKSVFARRKREFYNQVTWMLEHLKKVAPDEERLLRDLATMGSDAYANIWGENEFREAFAHHLESYGLVRFVDETPEVTLGLIGNALQKPPLSEFAEQKRQLQQVVEELESAMRRRIQAALEKEREPAEAVQAAVQAIPADAKTRAMKRQDLIDIGEAVGVAAVLDNLNWSDYELLLAKFYDAVDWVGPEVAREERLKTLRGAILDAHLVRHNNDSELRKRIGEHGYSTLLTKLTDVRDMLAG